MSMGLSSEHAIGPGPRSVSQQFRSLTKSEARLSGLVFFTKLMVLDPSRL